jgi:hypothetical protein
MNTENTTCRNCQTEMPEHSLYCPKCSQKNTDGRIPILSFVKDLLENIFSLDSKIFKTSLGLFIPGKLTNKFFQGKHKSFATPSRLFLASALLFFAVMSVVVQDEIKDEKITGNVFGIGETTKNKIEQMAQLDEVKVALEGKFSEELLQAMLDSAATEIQKSNIDTSFSAIELWNGNYKILTSDFKELSVDSIIQKYKVKGLLDQMIFKQGYKLKEDPKSLVIKLIGNLTWMMLLLIPSMALIFKLLYIRRKQFYVEHLVFLFHIHAFMLLVGGLFLVLKYFFEIEFDNDVQLGFFGILVLYTLFAFKNVYRQSWRKTLFKLFLILIAYFFVLIICVAIISTVSFLLF